MSGLLLITTLNARNPIPNAASILSHSPKTLVLIKHDSLNEFVEEGLKLSFQRLESWCESSLERLYGFDYEFDFGPEYPPIPPEIHIIDFESKIQTERAILSLVEEIAEQEGEAPEIRCECNAGRKEDSAMMVDISSILDGSCWYTDVDSGISVCIGDTGEESLANQLSPFSRFWLSGFPCIAGYEIPGVREKEILRVVLNCFSESLNSIFSSSDNFVWIALMTYIPN